MPQGISRRRMMQSVPQADVVITNPTHFAVAIKYDKNEHEAPIVLAKGADYLARKIKDVAAENSIEIVENKPLARMLYHNVDIGAEIPPELYQMVAEVLAYVYNLKGKYLRVNIHTVMLCYHIYAHTVVYKLKVILKLLLIYGGMYEKTGLSFWAYISWYRSCF